MTQLLSRLFIERYYKLNAGFFLTIFIALFGIMSGSETIQMHHAIMQAITSSPTYLCIALAVFSLYNFKCISFGIKELGQPANSFLYNMQGLGNSRQFGLYLYCHSTLYMPMLIYGLLTAYVGFSGGHVLAGCIVLLWQLAMCAGGAFIYFYQLNTTWRYPAIRLPSFTLIKQRSYHFYLLYHSLYSRKGAIMGIKVFSLLLLQFLVVLNSDKPSKENICFLIFLCISTHALLPVYYADFMERQMAFMRNMPLALWQRYAQYLLTYAIVFLPELLFLLWNERNVLPVAVIFSLYVLAISRMMLFTSMQYIRKMNTNTYTGVIFVLFFVTLILIASVQLWLFAFAELLISVVLFVKLYDNYEISNKPVEE